MYIVSVYYLTLRGSFERNVYHGNEKKKTLFLAPLGIKAIIITSLRGGFLLAFSSAWPGLKTHDSKETILVIDRVECRFLATFDWNAPLPLSFFVVVVVVFFFFFVVQK